jgi:hypothetical protein
VPFSLSISPRSRCTHPNRSCMHETCLKRKNPPRLRASNDAKTIDPCRCRTYQHPMHHGRDRRESNPRSVLRLGQIWLRWQAHLIPLYHSQMEMLSPERVEISGWQSIYSALMRSAYKTERCMLRQ